jgi:hypothetical protein
MIISINNMSINITPSVKVGIAPMMMEEGGIESLPEDRCHQYESEWQCGRLP